MQQTNSQQYNALELGLTSVSNILSEISQSTNTGIEILKSIQLGFENFNNYMSETVTNLLNTDFFKQTISLKNRTNDILDSININLSNLYEFITKKKPDGKVPDNKDVDNSKKDEKLNLKDSVKDLKSAFDPKILSEFILMLSTKLNKKLYKNMQDFNLNLDKMLSIDEKKINNLEKITAKLSTIFEKFNQSTANFDSLSLGLIKIAGAIGILTLSLIATSFIDPTGTIMLFGFIGGLAFLMNRRKKSEDLPKNMIEFAGAIGILTLSMIAMSFVEWSSIFKMLTFIGILGFMLMKINKPMPGGPGNMKMSGILSLAFGLGLIALAILAFDELPFMGMIKLLTFIGILGAEIILINKLGGGAGPMKGLPGFAFGMGLLVLSMFAMNELPWEALAKTLLFIGGLGLVLKLFSPKSGINMLMISGGLIAIAGAFFIFKKTGFGITDALTFAGSIAIIGAVVLGLGIPAVSGLVLLGSATLAALSISALLAAGSLWAISKLKIDFQSIFNFMLSVGILAAGFALAAPLAAIGAIGALAFIPIAVSALLGALSLAAIAKLTFNVQNIWDFIKSVGLLTLGFAAIAIPAIPGAIGAALFIPIGISALLGAGTLAVLALIPFNVENVWNFIKSVGLLTVGYAAIAIPAIPAAVGAALFLPIGISALLAAKTLQILSTLNIDIKKIDDFKLGLKGLIGAYDSLGMIQLVKTSAKAVLLLPIALSAFTIAKMFQMIAGIDVNKSSDGLKLMIGTLSGVFKELETWKNENSKNSIRNISDLANSINKFNNDKFQTLSNTMNTFINSLSDDVKWQKINKNLNSMSKNFKEIVSNINMLNLQKSLALEKNLTLLSNKTTNDNFTEVIKKLKEMIGLLTENQQKQLAVLEGNSNKNNDNVDNDEKQIVKTSKQSTNQIVSNQNSAINDEFINLLNQMLSKLDGTLQVAIVDGNSNRIR